MNLVPSDQFSYAELAELFTRGYEGYFVPMHFDEPTLRYMVDTWDIDLVAVAGRARRGALRTSRSAAIAAGSAGSPSCPSSAGTASAAR